jgi:hypothetical protein
MLRVSIFSHNAELTDTFLRQRVALGADAIDFGGDREIPVWPSRATRIWRG